MKNLLIALAAIVVSASVFAEDPKPDFSKMTKEEKMERLNRLLGGKIVMPNTLKGKIVFVNGQKKAKAETINESIKTLHELTNLDIHLAEGEFAFPSPKIQGEASIFIVDDPKLPSLLSAPENRWVLVNVNWLSQGEGVKEQFFDARVKKELTRGFCLLAGSQDSNYPNSLMGCKTKPEQLDSHVDCRLPVDIPRRFKRYLEGYGIAPAVILPYRQACIQGWAPAPTNELQKAVWDDVQANKEKGPSNGIKIRPPKK